MALLAAAVSSYFQSRQAYLASTNPTEAFALRQDDPRAAGIVLGQHLQRDPNYNPGQKDLAVLKAALRLHPLDPGLLALRGLFLDRAGQGEEALTVMRLADRASRRGAVASLYLIEAASASGDVPGTLRHYHAAMAVHPALRENILPALAAGIAYPEVREALRPYLERPVNWTRPFLEVAAIKSTSIDLEALLQPLPAVLRDTDYQTVMGSILHRLAIEQGIDAASRFASSLIPGFRTETLADFAPSKVTLDPRLGGLAWRLSSIDGLQSEMPIDGRLVVTVAPLVRGVAAMRDLPLAGGGRYILTYQATLEDAENTSPVSWTVSCLRDGNVVSSLDQRLGAEASTPHVNKLLTVPAKCGVLRLALQVLGPESQWPTTIELTSLSLKRLQ